MLKNEKNYEHFVICGPLAKFLLLKLILRSAQQSEFDMHDVTYHFSQGRAKYGPRTKSGTLKLLVRRPVVQRVQRFKWARGPQNLQPPL